MLRMLFCSLKVLAEIGFRLQGASRQASALLSFLRA